MLKYAIFIACVLLAPVHGSLCTSNDLEMNDPSGVIGNWTFGIQDSDNGISTVYEFIMNSGYKVKLDPYGTISNGYYNNLFNYWINAVPLSGGKNYSGDTGSVFIRTANFTCETDHSALWGPAYPDYRSADKKIRGRYQNLEAYVHYSAPRQTSYVRSVLYIKNVGSVAERVHLVSDWFLPRYAADLSTVSNEGRYLTMFPWQAGDLGANNDDPASRFTAFPNSLHVGGPKGRYSDVLIVHDMAAQVVAPVDYAELEAGQEMALMFVVSIGRNRTNALKNAADIDAEPAFIFHDLNADQLALIRNWGGCQVVLGPGVEVTVQEPTQCSSGQTSDFNVKTTTTRTDFTSAFTHRVVLETGDQLVAPQSSATITVPNDVGAVVHQLWYKECLIKETPFTACVTAGPSAVPTTSNSPTSNTPTQTKTSTASRPSSLIGSVLSITIVLSSMFGARSSLAVVCVLLLLVCGAFAQNSCTNLEVGAYIDSPAKWYFGTNDGSGSAAYSFSILKGWGSYHDFYGQSASSSFVSEHVYSINGVPLTSGKNDTIDYNLGLVYVPTANFTCVGDYGAIWGPAYPDFLDSDENKRGQFHNLESYVHFSAPSETSYVRSILFMNNIGSQPERVRLYGDWRTWDYCIDRSPMNGGRYYTSFPWQEGDIGESFTNPAESYTSVIESVHVAGPKGRDIKKSKISPLIGNDFSVSPAYYTTLQAGQAMALMYITSYGVNLTMALKNAAEIDSEPAYIFHDLNADQLSLIRNWGGCQVVLGPEVEVTVQEPTQCSSGQTSDFTIKTTTARTDLTTDFTHRVVSAATGTQLVAPQSSTTLAVPNNSGPVKHQLWYRECLVKETAFNSCTTQT